MPSIDYLVKFDILSDTPQGRSANFGTPMILDYHTAWPEVIRFYSELSGLVSDGLGVNSAAYKVAAAVFSQSPRVDRLAIGRRASIPDRQVDITPVVANNRVYTAKVLGPAGLSGTASFTSDGTATAAEIVAGLVSAINTLAVGVVATDQATFVRCKAATPGLFFAVESAGTKQTHSDTGVTADLAAISAASADWYSLTMSSASSAEIVSAAAWAVANKKLMVQGSQDSDILAAPLTDVAGILRTANSKSAVFYHQNPAQFAGAALLGSVMAVGPGGVTAALRKLASVDISPLSDSEIVNLRAKNAMFFSDFGGYRVTLDGKLASGDWLDVVRDEAWFRDRMQQTLASVLTSVNKLPYTDAGALLLENAMRSVHAEGVTAGFVVAGTDQYVTPKVASVPLLDRQNRKYRVLQYSAQRADAIHSVEGTGRITITENF